MSASISDHVDNLSDGLNNNKCTNCKFGFDYMTAKDGILIFKCFECKKNYTKDFDKELINKFSSTYDFCKEDINEFIILLRKVSILMNTFIVGIDLVKHHYLIKKTFIVV